MPHKPKAAVLQTFIFKRGDWNLTNARAWLRRHGHSAEADVLTGSYRFRQRDPKDFVANSFRTIVIAKGIEAVVGHLRPGKT